MQMWKARGAKEVSGSEATALQDGGERKTRPNICALIMQTANVEAS